MKSYLNVYEHFAVGTSWRKHERHKQIHSFIHSLFTAPLLSSGTKLDDGSETA